MPEKNIKEIKEFEINHLTVCTPTPDGPKYGLISIEQVRALQQPVDGPNTVSLMNVGEIIDASMTSQVAKAVQEKYLERSTAGITNRTMLAVIGSKTPPDFIRYQYGLRGYQFNTLTVDYSKDGVVSGIENLVSELAGKKVKAYMPTADLLANLQEMGSELAGWDEESIKVQDFLNNKFEIIEWLRHSDTHRQLVDLGLTKEHTNAAPHAIKVTKEEMLTSSFKRIDDIERLYKKHGDKIKEHYQNTGINFQEHEPGVIIRPTWGGGSYETFLIKKTSDGYSISHEGNTYNMEDWEKVDNFVNKQWESNGASNEYVITRYLKTVEDPGINCLIFADKEKGQENTFFWVAPAHGQVLEGTMCVGTKTANPPTEKMEGKHYYDGTSPFDEEERKRQLKKSEAMAAFVTNRMALDAVGNIVMGFDDMITEMFEAALAHAVKNTEDQFEAVGPHVAAEANMRRTQRTMHQETITAIQKNVNGTSSQPMTFEDLMASYQQPYESHDSHPVTIAGWNRLMALVDNPDKDHILAGINGKKEGIYIIMPPKSYKESVGTMGIGVMASDQESLDYYKKQLATIANGHEEVTHHHEI
jgi:hypothetical protein